MKPQPRSTPLTKTTPTPTTRTTPTPTTRNSSGSITNSKPATPVVKIGLNAVKSPPTAATASSSAKSSKHGANVTGTNPKPSIINSKSGSTSARSIFSRLTGSKQELSPNQEETTTNPEIHSAGNRDDRSNSQRTVSEQVTSQPSKTTTTPAATKTPAATQPIVSNIPKTRLSLDLKKQVSIAQSTPVKSQQKHRTQLESIKVSPTVEKVSVQFVDQLFSLIADEIKRTEVPKPITKPPVPKLEPKKTEPIKSRKPEPVKYSPVVEKVSAAFVDQLFSLVQ
eukprot:c15546_g1_i1.p1 GENE.c15546_g1_i1~~c15546_g1_i1.p1  ORF type:complete len:281 (-),score=123.77 c15546_g1_i1:31-873(-)